MIYDCFTFFNELDLLEIRLNTLKDVVDKFILVEAMFTHTGAPKPLFYKENRVRYAAFNDRIIHLVVDKFPDDATSWERENIQRNAIADGLRDAAPSDVVMISDVDEIPRPEVVARESRIPGVKRFLQTMSYYYVNYMNFVKPVWEIGTVMMPYREFVNPQTYARVRRGDYVCARINSGATATLARFLDKIPVVRQAGWHFSYLGGVKIIAEKIKAFSHQEFNTEINTNEAVIESRIRAGEDVFGRGDSYLGVPLDGSFPRYLLENQDRFRNLIFPLTPDYLRKTRGARRRARLKGLLFHIFRFLVPRGCVPCLMRIRNALIRRVDAVRYGKDGSGKTRKRGLANGVD